MKPISRSDIKVWVLDGPTGPGDHFFFQKPSVTSSPPEETTAQTTPTAGLTTSYTSTTFNTGTTETSGNSTWARTVILIERNTKDGEDLFIDGGIDHAHRQGT